MKGHVLIVDHEVELAHLVTSNLQRAGLCVERAATARSALDRAPILRPDLILIDLMLPDLSGAELCRRLREAPATRRTPIIMITAHNGESERIISFELGADDVVLKPFSVRELVLRVAAVLRRSRGVTPEVLPDLLQLQGLTLHRAAHRVFVQGEEIHLTRAEFELLDTILSGGGRVYSRDALLTAVWGPEANVMDRTVDVHIMRLRRKLGDAASCIETVRGVGYRAS